MLREHNVLSHHDKKSHIHFIKKKKKLLRNHFITARMVQLPVKFIAMAEIYQSQKGKSSLLLKEINHIPTSL